MTDAQLLEVCRRRPWERRLEAMGCGLSLVVGTAAAIAVYVASGQEHYWLLVTAAFVLGGLGVASLVDRVINFRSRRHQSELLARHAPWEPSASSWDAVFECDAPPDWVVVLRGYALPHGGTHSARVLLWEAHPPHAHLDVRTISDVDFNRDEPFTTEVGEVELTPEECQSLLAMLPDLLASSPEEILSMVEDGFPCEVAAARRQPRTVANRKCNLAGVSEVDAAHPAPRLMTAILEIGDRATTESLVFGWCDPFGNIGIGGV